MAIPTCLPRRLAAVLVAVLLPAFGVLDASAQANGEHMLPAGRDTQNDYTVDADSIQRDGSTVRFRLAGVSVYPGATDTYAAQVLVDCARHARREMGSEIRHATFVHRNGPDSQMRDVFAGTRQDSEMRLVCRLAGVPVPRVAEASPPPPAPEPAPAVEAPAPAPAALAQGPRAPFATPLPDPIVWTHPPATPFPGAAVERTAEPARPAGRPHAIAPDADVVAAGSGDRMTYAILVDSVRRRGNITSYDVQALPHGAASASWQHYVAECSRRLRAFQPEDTPNGTRLTATPVTAGSREGRELATACALPEGPRQRWFAGFVVTPDGVVVAPHERTAGCISYATGWGARRRTLELIGHEDDVTLLRIADGGPWPVMPAFGLAPALAGMPVTMLGVFGTTPRVSAAVAEGAGSNADDPGWPQVATLRNVAMREGIVWNSSGSAIGLALAQRTPDARATKAFTRMLPASEIRKRLERHGVAWRTAEPGAIDAEAAMRLALSATIALTCERSQ